MPTLVNGFGVWNWGKHNVHSHLGACDQCGAVAYLSSYDTRRYLTAIGPIIPLGRRRVVFHCPSCDHYRYIKMNQWESDKAEARQEALRAVAEQVSDPDAVEKAIHKTMAYQDAATFEEIAPRIRQAHSGNAGVLHALSDGFDFFGHEAEALETIAAASHLENTPELREATAWLLLRARHADEARQWLAHVGRQSRKEGVWHLFHLIQCYQALGRHTEALEVIHDTQHAFPELKNEKEWVKLLKLSEKHLATSKPVEGGLFNKNLKPMSEQSVRMPLIAALAGVVAVFAAYFYWAWHEGQNREVYFVNGLDVRYEYVLDGEPFTLSPGMAIPKTLVEGEHAIAIPSLNVPPQSFTVSTNYFVRPFLNRLFVVNPDQVAVLIWEVAEYSENPDDSDEYEFSVHTNALLHQFKNVNYRFEEFPPEIQIEGSKATRRRVALADFEPTDLLTVMAEHLSPDAMTQYIVRRFHHRPSDLTYVGLIAGVLEPDSFLEEILGELAKRPVLMEVHRAYQTTMQRSHPEHDLEAEYAAHLAEDPQNGDFVYLLGRVTEDRAESLSLFRRAAEGDPPSAYALNALAFDALVLAEFEEAQAYCDRARALQSENPIFDMNLQAVRLALGDYDALLAEIERGRSGIAASFVDALTEVSLLALNGTPPEEIEKRIKRYVALESKKGLPAELRPVVTDGLTLAYVYALGDRERASELLDDPDNPAARCQAALLRGDFAKAAELSGGLEIQEQDIPFVIYMLAARAGNTELAEQHLAKATATLSENGYRDEKYAAACLSGEEVPDQQRLLELGIWPETKRTILAALGVRFPENQDAYFDLARKLNYDVAFPHYVLKDILGTEERAPGNAKMGTVTY